MKFLDITLRCAWELNPHGGHTNAGAAVPVESGGAGRQVATLEDFSVRVCRRFARVEAAREAKNRKKSFLSRVTSGARCCGRVASIGARRKPVGGDGVAEVVGLQTQTWYWPD